MLEKIMRLAGVAPSEILGIGETINTATTRLQNRIFETGKSLRVPIDIVNESPQKPFMDEHFFSDDNMELDFEFNIDHLIHETQHYLGNMDIECPSCHALHWLDEKLANSSCYRTLFGTCCKQGKIRLPILQPLPPAMQVLYDDDSSHGKSFQSHIPLNARVTRNPQLNTDVFKIIQDNLMEYNPFVRIYRQTYESIEDIGNRLIWDQEHLTSDAQHAESLNNVDQLNDEQRYTYNVVINSVRNEVGIVFFLNGAASIRKMFVYNSLAATFCNVNKIAILVVSSGIASLLLNESRTSH
ncbi:hypothetical protein GIB67_041675 [Kingdonia uniflora]|uniref:ATP-dependent DNA helicase n=1 Tax=Kingdonia uniflora TaxID=39325 RepID=A0A7J7MQU7_9MAGN|nr:hypothetical protein GIB67_041675 [Kingdonia uniflora]